MTSPVDRDATADPTNIGVIPVSLDLNQDDINSVEKMPNSIVFSGNVGYYSDKIAILYFCEEIFPIIKEKIPEVKLHILGRNPSTKIKKLADRDKNILITGFVKNLHGYLRKACVSIAPMKVGSGTLIKILEAMDLGVPVVTTTVGNGGIGATNGKDVIIADTPVEFAQKTIELLENKMLRDKIARNAKKFLQVNFSEEIVLKKTEKIYQEAIDLYFDNKSNL
jgi:UDP-N-acetylglucosamine 2-epimerase